MRTRHQLSIDTNRLIKQLKLEKKTGCLQSKYTQSGVQYDLFTFFQTGNNKKTVNYFKMVATFKLTPCASNGGALINIRYIGVKNDFNSAETLVDNDQARNRNEANKGHYHLIEILVQQAELDKIQSNGKSNVCSSLWDYCGYFVDTAKMLPSNKTQAVQQDDSVSDCFLQ